ncbi:hypothetical protein V1514DRAFT_368806 [Lipomyces japonicus]|uniref:mitochondrial 54S ribosomal protein uL16m n=1 Tax=Lipomyces japonicus TaxID=56871 RepID=UPI0034CFC6BD
MNPLRTFFSAFVRRTAVESLPNSIFTSQVRHGHQYAPNYSKVRKQHKGRVPVRIGGSSKGTTLEFGSFGIRLASEGVRVSAKQLTEAENVMLRVIRPLQSQGVRMYARQVTNVMVCTKGNETRMGKGKGGIDYWAVRIPTGKIVIEIGGPIHEQVAREALRLAAGKLPGKYEVVTAKSDSHVVGFQKVPTPVAENAFEKQDTNPSLAYYVKKLSSTQGFAHFRP